MKYTRNAAAVFSVLVKKDSRLITKVPCQIHIPQRFEQINFAQVGMETFIYGLFALVLESGEYSVCNLMGMVKIVPDQVTTQMVGEAPYLVFSFDAGSTVIENTAIIKNDNLFFPAISEFIFRGNIPWYLNYEDIGKLFDTAQNFAGNPGGRSYEVNELLASMVSRSKLNRSQYYRLSEKPQENDPDFVGLTNIFYSVKNTVNKLAGSYFTDGLVSALVEPSESTERIEQLLRT